MLWRSPGFTAVALATIALGIGGNITNAPLTSTSFIPTLVWFGRA